MIADNIRALLQELEQYKSRYTTAVGIIERMKYQVGQVHASLAEAQEAEAQLRQSHQVLMQSHQEAQERIERLEYEAKEAVQDYPPPAVPEVSHSQD